MSQNSSKALDTVDGVATFTVTVPGAQEPRVIKRVSDLRRQIIMIGRADDPAALADLRQIQPDLSVRLPRPVVHIFLTDQPNEIIVVIGPADVLTDPQIIESYAAKPLNKLMAHGPRFVLALEMLHELHVVTGMPGSGRRNYIVERLRRMESMAGPGQMSIVRTTSTRKLHNLTDPIYYDLLSSEQFEAKRAAGELLQVSTYGDVSYGIDRAQLLAALNGGNAICLLIESRVDELLKLGFPVYITEMGLPKRAFVQLIPDMNGKPTIH
ncbi:MAG: hypothetical protein V1738_02810 [Patescibacteria group bacterium]